jgi:hypothetical protein
VRPIWADASAHRIQSDLAPRLSAHGHRLLVASDLNLLYGYSEHSFTSAHAETRECSRLGQPKATVEGQGCDGIDSKHTVA